MFQVVQTLKFVKRGLKELNKGRFSDVENRHNIASKALEAAQVALHRSPSDVAISAVEHGLHSEVLFLKHARQKFLRQKSKCQWLVDGDDNTAFFHSTIKHRRLMNKVLQISDMKGIIRADHVNIQDAFVGYYRQSLGQSNKVMRVHIPTVRAGKCLTASHKEALIVDVTGEEIKTALFSIDEGSRIYILSKTILKKIDDICRNFL
ncbi:hypothetical protein RND81_11G114500 [Saponaria officinalis]|uniref:Uncharacterized protein n=1 Tax=Saponaria officinalis TaxID=3572 RepID=A0AAW1HJT8_SAPOF